MTKLLILSPGAIVLTGGWLLAFQRTYNLHFSILFPNALQQSTAAGWKKSLISSKGLKSQTYDYWKTQPNKMS